MGRLLGPADVEAALRGGAVFACGGGGWTEHGRMLGQAAVSLGRPELVGLDEVEDDAWIATAAAIGAPGGSTDWEMLGVDYVRAVQLLQDALGAPLYGLMIGQNGKSSTLNAWLPGALLGTKVIDAVGDVRAHPTGDMGALGMASRPEATIQTAAGGRRARDAYIELTVRGATGRVSPILRTAADRAGGFIASCRNPVRASFVKTHAALGGVSLALSLGEAILAAEARGGTATATVDAICAFLGGEMLADGEVSRKAVAYTSEAFDIGTVVLSRPECDVVLHVMNEYMAVTGEHGERLASYPDVIATLDPQGRPVSVGEIEEGMRLLILRVPKARLPLSASVRDPTVYPPVEAALGLAIAPYALAEDAA